MILPAEQVKKKYLWQKETNQNTLFLKLILLIKILNNL